MSRLRALLVMVPLAALTTAGFCVNPGTPPPTDRCDSPTTPRAPLTLEVGPYDNQPFRALVDGDQIAKQRGGQGAEMVPYRLRVSGADAPACLGQVAVLETEAGAQLARLDAPLTTYPDANGARTTSQAYLIFDGIGPPSPTRVRLTVDAGGVRLVRMLELVDLITR